MKDDRISAPDKDEDTKSLFLNAPDQLGLLLILENLLSIQVLLVWWVLVVVLKVLICIDDEDDDTYFDRDEHFETMDSDDDEDADKLINTAIGVVELSKNADFILE